jgi:hypothetical protein
MAEEVEKKPDETEAAAAVATEPDDPFPDIDFGDRDEAPAEEEVVAEEAAAPVIEHSPELLDQATRLMIPADEVAAMSSDELRRLIKHADRVGQTVYNEMAAKKPAETKPADKPALADELAVLDDPEKYNQELVQPLKAVLVKQAKENAALLKRLEQLEGKTGQTEAQMLHSRLMVAAAEISPDLLKTFDLGTKTGQARYQELLDEMGVKQRHNRTLTEKQLLAKAVKAMELVTEKPSAAAAEVAEKKKQWSEGALSQGTSRKAAKSAYDVVGEIIAKANREARGKPAAKPTNGSGK